MVHFRRESELKRRLQNRTGFRLLGIEIITTEETVKIHRRIIPRPQRYQTMGLHRKNDRNSRSILLVFMCLSGCVVSLWLFILDISDTWRPESTHNSMRKRLVFNRFYQFYYNFTIIFRLSKSLD
jgi:hypothetical protein